MLEFVCVIAAIDEDVCVLSGYGDGGATGVEMEADDEIGLNFVINVFCAGSDFRGAVEESFDFEIFWGGCCDWFFLVANEGDFGSECFEFGAEEFGGFERHAAFSDDQVVVILVMTFFHLGVFAADVAGVQGDMESVERSSRKGSWFSLPGPDGRGGCLVCFGEAEVEICISTIVA